MDNQAFDEALRRVVADEKLPYDADAWTRMTARLEAHGAGKKRGFVIPLPAARWAAAAAVVLVALAGAWFLGRESSKKEESIAATSQSRKAEAVSSVGEENLAEKIPESSVASSSTPAQPVKVSRKAGSGGFQSAPTKSQPSTPLHQPTKELPVASASEEKKSEKSPVATQEPQPVVIRPNAPRAPVQRIEAVFEDEPLLASAKTGFDINGGYGGGAGAKNNFALGVAVKRNLNSRLQLEAGLGVVSGEYNTTNTVTVTTLQTPSGGSGIGTGAPPEPVASTAVQDQPVTERIAYVQAAPTLSYKVAGGLALGGGVDAQRRISGVLPGAKSNNDAFSPGPNSYASEEAGPRPDWDFGLTARADYNVSKRLRLGVMYRESVRTTSTTEKKAAGRNYMLVQLGFKLF